MQPLQDDVKQQLANAINARKKLENAYESQFKILAQFVVRLSLVCKGTDLELDNRLAKLRTELTKGTDLEKLIPFITDTSQSLQLLDSKQQREIKEIQQQLNQAGKLLQQQKGLPDQLRRDLRLLLSNVAEPPSTVQAFLPHLTSLTNLYQTALHSKQQFYNTGEADDVRYGHICRQISVELTNLLSELAFAEKSAPQIAVIRQSLLDTLSIEALLDACLQTITIIVASINEERLSAEHFLLQLNDALSSVQHAVSLSLKNTDQLHLKLDKLNQQIEQQIDQLGQSTRNATSLEQLKQLVTQRLGNISDALKTKEQLETQERHTMLSTLKDMELRLTELETEAQTFRTKLAEQNFRSLQDSLTEIPNRAAFDERLALEIKRWQRYKKPLSIALADVDNFKSINDNYGHSAGDKTLKVIARALQQGLRETDFIARYGGEEFVILFPETSLDELTAPLNTLREKIKSIVFTFKNQKVPITISFGASQLTAEDTSRQVFDRADEALYEAKKAGRDRVILKI
ncbi:MULTISPECIES: GGDEF domain-containing protein [unclassified Arsukibacterium]|uniref:GGDEF domain-containing protein n=1 Tax=unclassified Arsukibacterium TaxID=2635278 RepID=UPI0025BD53FB|nr:MULTISPECIES: GGDEF domain-containing protein [unclassified Arsukibacterium]